MLFLVVDIVVVVVGGGGGGGGGDGGVDFVVDVVIELCAGARM